MTEAELLEQGRKAQYFLDFLMRCRERALTKRREADSAEAEKLEVSPDVERREADRLPPVQPSI